MKMKKIKKLLSISLLMFSVLLLSVAEAAKPITYSGGRERAAIRGYDAVAYFTENKPVKGSKEFTFEYQGAKWLFASQANLDLFESTPEKYAPQFGGYCAYAVARGSTASIKPKFFTIYEDKLYLNYSESVYKKWIKDKDDYIKKANNEWPKVIE